MPRIYYSDEDKAHARELWESGQTYEKINEQTGISIQTLARWRKLQSWSRGGGEPSMPDPEPQTETSGVEAEVELEPTVNDETEMLRAQLEASEAARIAAEAEADKFRPTADSPVLTEENIDEYVTPRELENEAMEAVAAEEKDRARRGLPKLEAGSRAFNAEVQERMAVLKLERIHNQSAHVPDDLSLMIPTRKVKMVNPNGVEVQVTVERQSNSADGQPMSGMKLMRDKGWKLSIVPETGGPKCLLADCYEAAGFSGNAYTNSGFCEGRGHEAPFDSTGRRQVESSNLSKGGELAHLGR